MRTVHGAQMSPRMARLWHFIRDERHIALTDFSTDQGVEAALPQLRAAAAVLDELIAAAPGDTALADMRRDLAAIMRRLPAARVDAVDRPPAARAIGKTPAQMAADALLEEWRAAARRE